MVENKAETLKKFSDIIARLKKYFWDVEFSLDSFKNHPEFCIERIAEGSVIEGYILLVYLYGMEHCYDVIINSRRVSDKTKNYWESLKANDAFSSCLGGKQ